MRTLEIILTHYEEHWSVGRKFFNMLELQRGVNFGDIRVTVINDGTDCEIDENILRPSSFPFEVRQITISHGGISEARNAGIENAEAKWIQFCDFDDMYANVYSLRNIMQVLDTEDYDLLWCDFYAEDRTKEGKTILNLRGENTVFIHGKVFRLDWLKESGLRFDRALSFNEDSAFCTIASLMIPKERIGKITCEAPGYIWTYREGSATGSQINKCQAIIGAYQRDKKVCEAFKQYAPGRRYGMMTARVICDAYWNLCLEEMPEELRESVEDFKDWYREHRETFEAVNREDMHEVARAARLEHETAIREEARRWGDDGRTVHRDIRLREWLKELTEG